VRSGKIIIKTKETTMNKKPLGEAFELEDMGKVEKFGWFELGVAVALALGISIAVFEFFIKPHIEILNPTPLEQYSCVNK
jgi:hypothetical protein